MVITHKLKIGVATMLTVAALTTLPAQKSLAQSKTIQNAKRQTEQTRLSSARDSVEYFSKLGDSYYSQKKYYEAYEEYKKIYMQALNDGGNIAPCYNLGRACMALGEYKAAANAMSMVIIVRNKYISMNNSLIKLNKSLSKVGGTANSSTAEPNAQIKEWQKDLLGAYLLRAKCCSSLNNHTEAAADYKRALAIDPKNVEALDGLKIANGKIRK